MSVQWNDSLSVGVSEIDQQHKELIQKVNDLFDACSQGKGKLEVSNTIKFLEEYVVTHFNAEEKLQLTVKYPDYAAHKSQHEAFIKDFSQLKKKFEEDGNHIGMVMHINRVVVDWLIKHIGNSDKALGAYIKSKN